MKKSLTTKNKIEEAALELFYRKGFDGATTSEIAALAGVAEGTIFRYFPTKKTILSTLIITFIERFGEKVVLQSVKEVVENNKHQPIDVLLKAIVMERYSFFKSHSDIIFVAIAEIRYHPDLKETLKAHIFDKIMLLVKDTLTELNLNEDIKTDMQIEEAFRSFVGASIAAIVQRELFYSVSFNRPFEEELDQIIDLFLNGLRMR